MAEAISARFGAGIDPRPFLRGLLLTGTTPAYLRAEIEGGRRETSTVASEAAVVAAREDRRPHLAPFLVSLANVELTPPARGPGVLLVEVELAESEAVK